MKKIILLTLLLTPFYAFAEESPYKVKYGQTDFEKHQKITDKLFGYFGDIGFYLSAKGGITNDIPNLVDGNLKSYALSGALGIKTTLYGLYLRSEIEYMYNNDEMTYYDNYKTDMGYGSYNILDMTNYMKTNSVMMNFYMDFLQEYKIRPYIGLGLGWARLNDKSHTKQYDYIDPIQEYTSEWDSQKTSNFFMSGIYTGFSFNLTDGLVADFGLRYMKSINWIKREDSILYQHNQQLITFGVRYEF